MSKPPSGTVRAGAFRVSGLDGLQDVAGAGACQGEHGLGGAGCARRGLAGPLPSGHRDAGHADHAGKLGLRQAGEQAGVSQGRAAHLAHRPGVAQDAGLHGVGGDGLVRAGEEHALGALRL